MSRVIPYISPYPRHFSQRFTHYNIFIPFILNSHVSRMTKKSHGNEASRAASQTRKEKETSKKKKANNDTDSSSDSDDDRVTERAAQEHRDKERKRRLAQAEADSVITDRMIAQAEARNQAKKAKLNLC